jgi:hypothetical protein
VLIAPVCKNAPAALFVALTDPAADAPVPIAFPVRAVTVPRDTLPAPLFVTAIVPPVPPFAVPVPAFPPLAAKFPVVTPLVEVI